MKIFVLAISTLWIATVAACSLQENNRRNASKDDAGTGFNIIKKQSDSYNACLDKLSTQANSNVEYTPADMVAQCHLCMTAAGYPGLEQSTAEQPVVDQCINKLVKECQAQGVSQDDCCHNVAMAGVNTCDDSYKKAQQPYPSEPWPEPTPPEEPIEPRFPVGSLPPTSNESP